MANHLYFSWFSFCSSCCCHSNCFIFAFLFGDMFACVRACAWFVFAFIFLLYSSETLYLIVSRYIDISLNGIYFIRRSIEIKLKDNNDTINNMWEKSLVTFHFGRKSENKKKTKKGKTNLVKTTNQHRQEINSELQNLPRLFDVQVYQSKV